MPQKHICCPTLITIENIVMPLGYFINSTFLVFVLCRFYGNKQNINTFSYSHNWNAYKVNNTKWSYNQFIYGSIKSLHIKWMKSRTPFSYSIFFLDKIFVFSFSFLGLWTIKHPHWFKKWIGHQCVAKQFVASMMTYDIGRIDSTIFKRYTNILWKCGKAKNA